MKCDFGKSLYWKRHYTNEAVRIIGALWGSHIDGWDSKGRADAFALQRCKGRQSDKWKWSCSVVRLFVTPGSSVHGILQARILDRVAISFSRWSSRSPEIKPRSPTLQADALPSEPPGKPQREGKWSESESHSVVSDSLRPHGLSMEFSRLEYWDGWPFPSPRYLPNPGIEPGSPASPPGKPRILEWVAYPFSSRERWENILKWRNLRPQS